MHFLVDFNALAICVILTLNICYRVAEAYGWIDQ